jgi:ketosteroid isomerase-like protein
MLNGFASVLLMVSLHLPVVGGSLVEQTDSANDERAIIEVEQAFARAAMAEDVPAMERIWAAEYQFTAPNGMVVTRDAYLAMIKAKAVVYDRVELQGLRVRLFGDTATVTGRADIHGKAIGHIVDGVDDFLTVYVKRDGRWQQVASHFLRVPGTTRSSGPAAQE